MPRTRRLIPRLAALTGMMLVLAACGGGSSGSSSEAQGNRVTGDPNTVNSADVTKGGEATYVIEKKVVAWNGLTADGNTFDYLETYSPGILPSAFIQMPDLTSVELNKDLLASAEVTADSPQTVVYKIRPEAVWSDGTPIGADDFIWAWKTNNGRDCLTCESASTTGYDQITSMTPSDGGKTVTAVFSKPFSDWKSLFSILYPSHLVKDMPLDQAFNTYFQDNPPTVSGGPYMIDKADPNVAITEVPNPKWYGATAPSLDKLIFRVITDATQEPLALKNGEVQAIYPQPEVDLLTQIKDMKDVRYQLDQGLLYEHFDFNLNNAFLKDAALRQAMFTAVDVPQIIAKTVGQFDKDVKQLNSRMLVPEQKGYQDNVSKSGYGKGDVDKAKKMLTDAGYTLDSGKLVAPNGQPVPAFTLRYTEGNAIRQSESNAFKEQVAPLGITVNVEPTDALGDTLTHASGKDYDIIVFGWVGTPFPSSANQPLFTSCAAGETSCGGNYGNYANADVDRLLADATTQLDQAKVIDDLNQADQQITADAYTLPLYQKPTLLAYAKNVGNIRDNATSVGPPYNVQEWGLTASTS